MTDPNPLAPLPATITILCPFTIATSRKDMNAAELIQYRVDWYFFNRVWAYQYTVSTLNGQAGSAKYSSFQFSGSEDMCSFKNGRAAHVAAYPSSATLFTQFLKGL